MSLVALASYGYVAALLGIAAYQDVKKREIDARNIYALFLPAPFLLALNLGHVLYLLNLAYGALFAAVLRILRVGRADVFAVGSMAFLPPLTGDPLSLPTLSIIINSMLLQLLWVPYQYFRNLGAPCRFEGLKERLTMICVDVEEVRRRPHRYIVAYRRGMDLERYDPRAALETVEGLEHVKAYYGFPTLLFLFVGLMIYMATGKNLITILLT